MEQILKDTAFYTVACNEQKKLAKIIWYGSPDEEDYQAPFLFLMELQKTKEIHYLLSDLRKQGVISPELRNWFISVALPVAVNSVLKKTALVYRSNPVKEYYLKHLLEAAEKAHFNLKFFLDYEVAENWLFEE